jgi:2-dehydropantoate 2-reductase
MERLTEEFYRVAGAEGVVLVSPGPRQYLRRFASELLPPTRDHRSSMQEDIERGRRTEIDALNGAICAIGAEHRIDTPTNEALAHMIRFLSPQQGD